MSDDEEASHSEEEEEEEEEEEQKRSAEEEERKKKEESEAEKALKKRREAQRPETTGALDETAKELLESNRHERERMEDEIQELRRRNERRKKEREIEEKRLASERAAEDERRKAAEEAKRRMKSEEEEKRQRERAKKMAEFEKWKNPPKPNFVIAKRSGSAEPEDDDEEEKDQAEDGKGRKSKEQLEAEKRAILQQRIKPLAIEGFDKNKLAEKAKELHNLIHRLEGEKYDLEKQFKAQQFDMMELAERARQANKVGKGGLKRIQPGPDDNVDKIQERFAGAPAKVEMYSKYERQKDKRSYDDRLNLYTGPQFVYPPERIKPKKVVAWNEEGIPIYSTGDEGQAATGAVSADAEE